jgi:hypothetical protein
MYEQAIITNDDRRAVRNTNKAAITYPIRTNEGLLNSTDVQMVLTMSNKTSNITKGVGVLQTPGVLTMSNKTSNITISSAAKTRVITPNNPDYRKVVNILNGNY